MMARSALVPFAVLALAGCDPLVAVHARITLPPGAIEDYKGPYPAQVLVTDDHDTHMIGEPPHAHRIAILCQKSDTALHFDYGRGGVGCAEETHLVAYVAPSVAGDEPTTCGALPQAQWVNAPPPVAGPSGAATLFAGKRGDCGNHEASADLLIRGASTLPSK